MKNNLFLVYAWGTVVGWFALILLISLIPNIDVENTYLHSLMNSIGYLLAYIMLFLLFFRATLSTFKLKVDRLMYWRSKREKAEDAEFARIIEFLILLVTFLSITILAIFDEYIQSYVTGRISSIGDVFIAVTGIMLAAIIVFAVPAVSEAEARAASLDKQPKK